MDEDEQTAEQAEQPEEQPAEQAEQPEDQAGENNDGFAALADLLAEVLQGLADLRADMAQAIQVNNAAAVDNGAAIRDAGEPSGDVDIIDAPVKPEDRDYSLD